MSPAIDISVVVPVYGHPEQLDRLLAGLDRQTLAADRFEVVVSDDGSLEPPQAGPRAYEVGTVRQHDEGFRAAAARNLGAGAASGDVIAFLDQDCVPAPDYLERVLAA
ncbi:MAG: glycosyltransferase, partial [Lapillicoccus sp.]